MGFRNVFRHRRCRNDVLKSEKEVTLFVCEEDDVENVQDNHNDAVKALQGRDNRAPVEDERTARMIDKVVQEKITRDAFGEEVTERVIRMRILEVDVKRSGDRDDLGMLPEDERPEHYLIERSGGADDEQV